ncbi:MAG: zinc-ribbon domain-containing protein [Nitrospirae bacterium]|nr:zinc-ribbon domain-containing protein [Nitrospirota bacterium]
MVVICPKCKVRLKVDETRLSPEGSRFKCPKCSAVLIVKKPVEQARKALDSNKIMVAHSNTETQQKIVTLLSGYGFTVITATDGIDVMVKALKELPFISIVEVALPKIYGFEICKRLKTRAETKEMKFILLPSIHDKTKYRRDPVSLYDADEYIEEHDLSSQLIAKINKLRGLGEEGKAGGPEEAAVKTAETPRTEVRQAPSVKEAVSPFDKAPSDEKIEKAKRLARTIINDIHLYNAAKVEDSIRNDNFYAVFSSELKEGKKLYDNRIPQEIRAINDFYKEAIENFISAKKKNLS